MPGVRKRRLYLLMMHRANRKNMPLWFLSVALFVFLVIPAAAQQKSQDLRIGENPPVQVGQALPDITITNLINYPTKTAKLSDFKGKLLILDFWSTSCGTSVAGLPVLDSIDRMFAGKVQVLLISSDNEEKVRSVFSGKRAIKNSRLPTVVGDSVLRKIFPHVLVPHVVLIDKDGIVIAITGASELTAVKVDKLLQGAATHFALKKDVLDYEPLKPLLVNGNGGANSNFLYRSIITAYLPGIRTETAIQRNKDQQTIRIKATNCTLLSIYGLAFPELNRWPKNRLKLEADDKSRYTYPDTITDLQAYRLKNLYCYDLQMPLAAEASLRKKVQQDLDMFFGLRTGIEQHESDVWLLVRTTGKDLATKGGQPETITLGGGKTFRNRPLSSLVSWLNGFPGVPPVLDDTGYAGTADITIRSAGSISALNRQLQAYDLALKEEKRVLPFFVMRKAETPNQSTPLTL
jgi:thiol-disulfide isomerase/thioredoxin